MRFGRLILWLELLFISQSASFAQTNAAVELSNEERAWIAQQRPLRVGVTPEWAPFSYFTKDEKPAGIDIDILNLISKRTGLRFEIVRTSSWKETLELAKAGRIDLVSGTAETGERTEFFEFTRSYYRAPVVIVSREDDHRFSQLALLREARIAMPRKHVTTLAIRQRLPSAKFVLADTLPDCFELVRREKADVLVANVFTVSRYLNEHPRARLGISGVIPELEFPLRFGVRKSETQVVNLLNKALGSISEDELNDITSRHLVFGLQGTHRTRLLRKRVIQVVIGAAAVAMILGVWSFFQFKEVRARRAAEEQLRQINRSLEIFSHSISHDLRGPLRTISSFAEILRQDYGDKLDAAGNDYLDRINAAADRMNVLMRDILAYSHASRAESSLSMVSLKKLIPQLIAEFPAEQRAYFEIVSDLPDVPANPTLLSQCLANLLSNAVKFVPKDRTPKIRIGAEREGPLVRIWVEDNGIGIAPEDQQRIFGVFERVQTDEYEGTGIGLAIVAKGAERMGGSVGVKSAPGQGSRFWIQLPAEPSHSRKPSEK